MAVSKKVILDGINSNTNLKKGITHHTCKYCNKPIYVPDFLDNFVNDYDNDLCKDHYWDWYIEKWDQFRTKELYEFTEWKIKVDKLPEGKGGVLNEYKNYLKFTSIVNEYPKTAKRTVIPKFRDGNLFGDEITESESSKKSYIQSPRSGPIVSDFPQYEFEKPKKENEFYIDFPVNMPEISDYPRYSQDPKDKGEYKYHYNDHQIKPQKMGKGYREGHPVGTVSKSRCREPNCDGHIVSVQISSGHGNVQTVSEKVCNKCGLVYNTGFGIIDKIEEKYTTHNGHKYDTHSEWLNDNRTSNMGNPEDICLHAESFNHFAGRRMNSLDNHSYGVEGKSEKDDNNYTYGNFSTAPNYKRYKQNLNRKIGLNNLNSEHWNRGTKERMKLEKKHHSNYVDICKTNLRMTKGQADEVKYLINKYGLDFYNSKGKASYESIIICMCIYVLKQGVDGRKLGRKLSELKSLELYSKDLYDSIKKKIES